MLRIIGAIAAAGLLALAASVPPAAAADEKARLKQAAQHFVDLEDDKARAILEELSAEGVTDADVLLGYLFSDGLYEGRDYEKAVEAFERAADGGNEEALFQVAEARYWPEYSDWTLAVEEEAIRPTAREAFDRLKRAVGDGADPRANAAGWRLAYLCTIGGYDCGDGEVDEALRQGTRQWGHLRVIKGVFDIIEHLRSGEADTPEGEERLTALIALGMADADPLVAGIASELFWRDFTGPEDCPTPGSLAVAGRLLAMGWSKADERNARRDLAECFSAEELELEQADLVVSLDKFVRGYGNQGTLHLWSCYQNPEAATFGDCLIHAVKDHYFVCTKLSMVDYFERRLEVSYTTSRRYQRCREHVLSARGR